MNELFKISMTADVGGFVSGMARADSATERVGVGLQGLVGAAKGVGVAFNDISNLAERSLKKVRNVGIGATTAAVGWGIAAANYETGLRNVEAIIGRMSGGQFNNLYNKTLTQISAFPQSISSSVSGLYQIVSAGYKGSQATDLLSVSLKTASAGMSDTETAANALIFALKAYGLSESEVSDVSDILFQTVNKGIVTFPQLAQGMGEWVAMAATAKVPLQDAASALAAMTLSGIDPAEAATSTARTLQSFVKPSQALTTEVKKLGYESPLAMLQVLGLHNSIKLLGKDTGGSATAVFQLFKDVRAARGVFTLLANDGKNYADTAGAIEDASARAGATTQAFAAQSEGAAFKFHTMVNELQRMAIQLGTPLLAPAKVFFAAVAGVVKGIGDLPGPIKEFIGLGTLAAGVILTIVGAFGAWQAKSLIMGGIFKAISLGTESMAAKLALSGPSGELAAAGLLRVSGAAGQAGSSTLRFGLGMSGLLTRLPVISTALNYAKVAIYGVGAAAIAAVVAFAAWQQIKSYLDSTNASAAKFWDTFQNGMQTNNVQEWWGAYSNVIGKVNSEIGKGQDMTSGWSIVTTAIGGAVDALGSFVGLSTGTQKSIDIAQQAGKVGDAWQHTADVLNSLGATESKNVFIDLWKSGMQLGQGLKFTNRQLDQFAESQGIQLINPQTHQIDMDAMSQLESALTHYIATWGKLPDVTKAAIDPALIKANTKYLSDYVDGVQKSFLDGYDAVQKFNNSFFDQKIGGSGANKNNLKNAFGFDTLKTFYQGAIGDTSSFLSNFNKAIAQGIDPTFLSRILTAGPNAAGDLLASIVSDSQGKYKSLINYAEGLLGQLSLAAVRQARLVAIATAPLSDYKTTTDLPGAQAVQGILSVTPKIDLKSLMKQTKLSHADLVRIGQEYKLPIPGVITIQDPNKTPVVKDSASKLQAFLNGMHLDAPTLAKAIDAVIPRDRKIRLHPDLAVGPGAGSSIASQMLFNGTIPRSEAGPNVSLFGKFDLNHQLQIDYPKLRHGVNEQLKAVGINLGPQAIDVLAHYVYKIQSGDALGLALGDRFSAKQKQQVVNTVVNLIGDKDAHAKLIGYQNQLKLTPAELYTAFSVIADKPGQDQVIDWIAKVKGLNPQNIVVTFDSNHKAHFFKDIQDAQNGVHELSTATATPHVDARTGEFDTKISGAKTTLKGLDGKKATVSVVYNDNGTQSDLNVLRSSLDAISGVHSILITSNIQQFQHPTATPTSANGNIIAHAYANGGVAEPRHVAQIFSAHTRVMSEPETEGEGYIPLAKQKRARSTAILGDIAGRFGYDLAPRFADGGVLAQRHHLGTVANNRLRQLMKRYHVGLGDHIEFVSDAYMRKMYGSGQKLFDLNDAFANGSKISGKIQVNYDMLVHLVKNAGTMKGFRVAALQDAVTKEYMQTVEMHWLNTDKKIKQYLNILGVKYDPLHAIDALNLGKTKPGVVGYATTPDDAFGYFAKQAIGLNKGMNPANPKTASILARLKMLGLVPKHFSEGHDAEMAAPGVTRVWNEPEAWGEGYIPFAPSKRGRSTNILRSIADRFGYGLTRYANGGIYQEDPSKHDNTTINKTAKQLDIEAALRYLYATIHKTTASLAPNAERLIQNQKAYDAMVAGAAKNQRGTASFAAAAAAARAANPITGTTPQEIASSRQQQNQAVAQAYNDAAKVYADVRRAAGTKAANTLAASGLTGDSYSNAGQKIIDNAQANKPQPGDKKALIEAKHTVGDITDKQYEGYLKHQLLVTKKYGADWMDAWQKLQDLKTSKMGQKQNLGQQQYQAGLIGASQYEAILKKNLASEKKYSDAWFSTYDELKQIKEQDQQTQASIEDSQYRIGEKSASQYLQILQERQAALKKNTEEWYTVAQQIKDLQSSFAQPYQQATDISSAMTGRIVKGFSEVKDYYTHTLAQSNDYLNILEKLKAAGLNASTLAQLQAAGPQDLSLADSILQGGSQGLSFVNDAQAQIDALTTRATNFSLGQSTGQVTNITLGGVQISIGAGSTITEQQVRNQFNDAFAQLKQSIEVDLGMGAP